MFRAGPGALTAAVVASFLLVACGNGGGASSGDGDRVAEPPWEGPSLFLIGNDRGMIRPCGCSKPVLGGVERRLAFLRSRGERMKESAVLAFGNVTVDAGRQQEMKLEAFAEVFNEAGVKAYCIGDEDLVVGIDYWIHTVSQLLQCPLVALNVVKGDERPFETHAEIEAGGGRWVVTSYVSPKTKAITEPGVRIEAKPDVTAVRAALKPGTGLVVFGTGSTAELDEFLKTNDLAARDARTLLVRTGVSDTPTFRELDGARAVIELGLKGRDVSEIPLPEAGRLIAHTLTAARGVDPDAKEILDFYRESVEVEKLLEKVPRVGRAGGVYAGSKACATCHEKAHATWAGSKHAVAWKTLLDAGESHDPECVKCHVPGFGLIGGFDPVKRQPVDVTCEACHGPSREHVENPLVLTPRGKLGPGSCVRCHDLANSPKFEFETYWPKIAHDRR